MKINKQNYNLIKLLNVCCTNLLLFTSMQLTLCEKMIVKWASLIWNLMDYRVSIFVKILYELEFYLISQLLPSCPTLWRSIFDKKFNNVLTSITKLVRNLVCVHTCLSMHIYKQVSLAVYKYVPQWKVVNMLLHFSQIFYEATTWCHIRSVGHTFLNFSLSLE